MRNHTALFTKNQECYRFRGPEDFKAVITLRYRLLPYLYSEFMKAALERDMLIRPLAFDFPEDGKSRSIEDQLLVGESIMIAPVLEKGAKGRIVYLPERMTEVRYDGKSFTCMEVGAGERTVMVPLSQVVFYIRQGRLVPVGRAAANTAELDLMDVELLGTGTSYRQYVDDGYTKECSMDRCIMRTKEAQPR